MCGLQQKGGIDAKTGATVGKQLRYWRKTGVVSRVPRSFHTLARAGRTETLTDRPTPAVTSSTSTSSRGNERTENFEQQGQQTMRDFNYSLKQLCRRNQDGSFNTRRDREYILDRIATQLQQMGYRHMRASSLRPKHVERLVEQWKADGLSIATMKNRMAEIRWWAEKIGKPSVVARDNEHYGIGERQYVTNVSKARQLTAGDLSKVSDRYTHLSLRLQAAFGLRRAESIKIRPEWADRGDRLLLKDTWCKGGRERELPVLTVEQRQLLDEAKRFAGRGSLIPPDLSYIQQLRRFEYQCASAGIHRMHGHRHQYAQTRYRELTGWAAPAAGGPRSRELSPGQRAIDREARLTISRELGHERIQIVGLYLGK